MSANSRSFSRGLKTSWATESPVTESRATQRVYPRSVQQRASPWRSTTLPARGWGPAIEHYQRATSSPSAQEGRHCAERWVTEGGVLIKGSYGLVNLTAFLTHIIYFPAFCVLCCPFDSVGNESIHSNALLKLFKNFTKNRVSSCRFWMTRGCRFHRGLRILHLWARRRLNMRSTFTDVRTSASRWGTDAQ